MKYLLINAFIIAVSISNSNVFAEATCEQIASSIINSNAQIEAKNYSRPFKRDLNGYARFLGRSYDTKHSQLKKGATVFDSGAGLGVAGLEDANNGLKVYAINAQDFWAELKEAPLGVDYDGPASTIANLVEQFNISLKGLDIPKGKVWDHEKAKEVLKPSLNRVSGKIRREIRARLFAFIEEKKEAGNFNYMVGFAEKRIPEIDGQADVIRDLYGAYFYSADKLELLDLYYNKLKKNGQAFIRISTGEGHSAEAFIEKNGKKYMSFHAYLLENYPTIFSIEQVQQGNVLVIKKDPNIASLYLSDVFELNKNQTHMVKMNETELPESWFSLKKKAKK
ncbi:MAG: hypothetical protein K2Q18_00360 [Bdellovibrionales bacterium]|nr:hypothetical protein [Bdellovibrionales bacterium]